jgi:hypothetical protein
MSATDTSFSLTRNSNASASSIPVYKYLDVCSSYRDRFRYPNPNSFVMPINYPSRNTNSSTAIDPVVGGVPYTGSTNAVGSNVTQSSIGLNANQVALDSAEPPIDNYYVNSVLQLTQFPTNFYTITSYDGTTKIATVNVNFPSVPNTSQVYFTRFASPSFQGTVVATVLPAVSSYTTFTLDSSASSINNAYVNSYVRFNSGANIGQTARILSYSGITRLVTLSSPLTNIPGIGDAVEIDSYTRDNASTLIYSGNISSSQNCYYEIELIWLSIPNQLLGNGYGGHLDAYPYVYVQLYNQGNQLSNQVLYSNNPNSTNSLFKVPVDQYYGSTSFLTLSTNRSKQVVLFHPDQDLYFAVTLPDGSVIRYDIEDTMSPNPPNPLLQVNALFSIRKLT